MIKFIRIGNQIEEKLYTCSVCKKEFSKQIMIKRYYNIIGSDTTEVKYFCSDCDKKSREEVYKIEIPKLKPGKAFSRIYDIANQLAKEQDYKLGEKLPLDHAIIHYLDEIIVSRPEEENLIKERMKQTGLPVTDCELFVKNDIKGITISVRKKESNTFNECSFSKPKYKPSEEILNEAEKNKITNQFTCASDLEVKEILNWLDRKFGE